MNNKITGKMFVGSGIKMSLLDILDLIPENNWQWVVYEFDAVGSAPDGMDMPEFESLVLSIDNGFNITWVGLRRLAESISDVNSCLLAAVIEPVSYSSINEENDQLLALVTISDSTTWELMFKE